MSFCKLDNHIKCVYNHYISFGWFFYPKRLIVSALNQEQQESRKCNFFREAQLLSATSKWHLTYTTYLNFSTYPLFRLVGCYIQSYNVHRGCETFKNHWTEITQPITSHRWINMSVFVGNPVIGNSSTDCEFVAGEVPVHLLGAVTVPVGNTSNTTALFVVM